jgi:hypothetical protein
MTNFIMLRVHSAAKMHNVLVLATIAGYFHAARSIAKNESIGSGSNLRIAMLSLVTYRGLAS